MRSRSKARVAIVLLAITHLALASSASAGYRHRGTFVMGGGVNTPEAKPIRT